MLIETLEPEPPFQMPLYFGMDVIQTMYVDQFAAAVEKGSFK